MTNFGLNLDLTCDNCYISSRKPDHLKKRKNPIKIADNKIADSIQPDVDKPDLQKQGASSPYKPSSNPDRSFRMLFRPFLFVAGGTFSLSDINENLRNFNGYYSYKGKGEFGELSLGAELILDFNQYIYLAFDFKGNLLYSNTGSYPNSTRQQNAMAGEAYNFMQMNPGFSGSINLGTYLYRKREYVAQVDSKYKEFFLTADLGYVAKQFYLVRGTDSWGASQILDINNIGVSSGIIFRINLGHYFGNNKSNFGFGYSLGIGGEITERSAAFIFTIGPIIGTSGSTSN